MNRKIFLVGFLLIGLVSEGTNLSQSPLVNLTNNAGNDHEPMWSPDGKRIAFYSNRNAPARPRWQMFMVNADGSNETLFPGTNEDFRPVWSPDGKKIAFDSYRDGNHEIYVANVDGSSPTRLTTSPDYDSAPRWSRDGKKIVYFSGPGWKPGSRDYGNSDIYVMNADGSGKTRVTTTDGDDTYPFFSPNGRRIVFTSWRDGNAEIYVMNADGTNQTRLTNNPARDDNGRWSPDGKKIGFGSNRDGNYEVYVMNADGSQQTNLTQNPANDVDVSWSPDGKRIAFASNRDGDYEIYVMRLTGKK